MIDLDRQLFELCKPSNVTESSHDERTISTAAFTRTTMDILAGNPTYYLWPWSPSTQWSDLEPLIVAACKEHRKYYFDNFAGVRWESSFEDIGGYNAFTGSAPILCESAARALISLLTAKAEKEGER